MGNLPLLFVIGVVATLAMCFAHSRVETTMPRSQFVFLGLIGLGSLPFGYIALWVIADQYPSFSLVPFLLFGIAMWAAALLYGAIAVIAKLRQKKDIAPSK